MNTALSETEIKNLFKAALIEVLEERPELVRDVFGMVIKDFTSRHEKKNTGALKKLFKEAQSLPHIRAMSDEEILDEVRAYRKAG